MKTMNKRILSLLLVLAMLCGLMSLTAFATEGTESAQATDDFVATEENNPLGNTVSTLPDGYLMVEYIESHGQAWIDTGVTPTAKTRSEVDYQNMTAEPTESMGIYGVFLSTRHQILYSHGSEKMSYGVGNGAYQIPLNTQRHYVILDAANQSVSLDGSTVKSNNGKDFTSANAKGSIYIFSAHQSSEYFSYARIYGVSIYEDDVLVHQYIPCYSESLMEYGMYDMVDSVFLRNSSGKGRFTGPDYEENEDSLVTLIVPEGVTLRVYGGFGEKSTGELRCVRKETVSEGTEYYFALPEGKYSYIAEGAGYYTIHKNFIVTRQDLSSGGKCIDANPGMKSSDGKYECGSMLYEFTDELLAADQMKSDALLAQFPTLLDTPAFSEEKAFAQFTSYSEMRSFLNGLNDTDDDLYLYNVGNTGKGKNIYLTVHTKDDLSSLTFQEAAVCVRSNGKPTVCIYGLIHGLEPSGGEGSLALIQLLDGAYGDSVLDKVNVIVMPWINGDGAERYIYGTPGGCANLNRFNLTVDYPELQATHTVYNLFMPEVVIAAHEKRVQLNGALDETGKLIDASLDISVNRNNTEQIRTLSKTMMQTVIEASAAEGFRMDRHEQDNVSGQYPVVETSYFGLRGSISVLVEVPGIRSGKDLYGRSTAAQVVAAKEIIEYVSDNCDTVMAVVAADRQTTEARGESFDDESLLTLRHGRNDNASWVLNTPTYHLTDGSIYDASTVTNVYFWEKSLVTRACPTAYVISADEEHLDYILRAADYNDIHYYLLPADKDVMLRRYTGTVDTATLEEQTIYRFETGAYVFPMNQASANVLAMLMEPDVYRTDSYAVSFAQGGKLAVTDIYRCEQNLINGKIPTGCAHTYENGICTICGEAQPRLVITGQPKDVSAERFGEAAVSVAAEGDGLTYAWYYRCAGETAFRTSACTGDTFRTVMSSDLHGCEVYCVITDTEGDSITSETSVLTLTGEEAPEAPPARIPGDLNGDGEVNNKDLTRLFRFLTGWDVELE